MSDHMSPKGPNPNKKHPPPDAGEIGLEGTDRDPIRTKPRVFLGYDDLLPLENPDKAPKEGQKTPENKK